MTVLHQITSFRGGIRELVVGLRDAQNTRRFEDTAIRKVKRAFVSLFIRARVNVLALD